MKYSRQQKLNFVHDSFQDEIRKKKIVVIGCGGVGSVLCELLIRGGFLNLTLVDNDVVDHTNLQRQIYWEEHIGVPKSKALCEVLMKIDSDSELEVVVDLITKGNIGSICSEADLVIDATDNFLTRHIINDYCESKKKDWVFNGAVKTEIVCATFLGKDKLFSKVFSKEVKDETACEVGVLASTTFSAASICYNQVLKYFLGLYDYKLIKMEIWTNKIHEVKLK